MIQALERRCDRLVKERDAEREQLESRLHAEHMRCELLLRIQEELSAKLASVAHALSDVTRAAECIVTECESGLQATAPVAVNHRVQSAGETMYGPMSNRS